MTSIEELEKVLQDHEKRIKKLEASSNTSNMQKQKPANGRKSITDLLVELKDEGFFDEPKRVNEIVEKMAENGHHYPGSSLTEPLLRAVKNRVLGRLKKEGQWGYVKR